MRTLRFFVAGMLVLAAARAQAEILLHGVVKHGERYLFSLSRDAEADSHWLLLGADFAGYKLKNYDADRGLLTLEADGKQIQVHLPDSRVRSATLRPEDLQQFSDADLESLGFHRIMGGETGAKIARAAHITLAELRALNPDLNFAKLHVGQIVVVSSLPDS